MSRCGKIYGRPMVLGGGLCSAITKSKIKTWNLGTGGLGDVGSRGRWVSGTWYARTSELGDARGFEDVINK